MRRVIGSNVVFVVLVALLLAVSMGGAFVLCTMSPLQHLSEWQQAFTTILSLLLLALVLCWYFLQDFLLPKQIRAHLPRQRDTGRIFDPLRLAFARGIIHTKVF